MAGKIPKTIEEVQNRLESTIDKIDVSKLDFGDIKMSQETNEFILNEENNLQEIIDYLNEFTNKLSAEKEQVKTEKINEKLMNEIKEGGEKASLLLLKFLITKSLIKIRSLLKWSYFFIKIPKNFRVYRVY
jgi:hypothetical protein